MAQNNEEHFSWKTYSAKVVHFCFEIALDVRKQQFRHIEIWTVCWQQEQQPSSVLEELVSRVDVIDECSHYPGQPLSDLSTFL